MEKENKGGLAVASLVIGIISLVISFIPILNYLSYIMGILAIIFAVVTFLQKNRKGLAIAGLTISIIAIVFAYESQLLISNSFNELNSSISEISNDFESNMDNVLGNNTEKILENYCEVSMSNLRISKDRYGFVNSEITVKVKNKSNEKKTFSIQIEAIKEDGTRIDTDYIYANNLNAGQTQEFKAFQFVSSENYNLMKEAIFNIVEVSMY